MKVTRIVVDIATTEIDKAKEFYQKILGLDLLMDHGWIITYGTEEKMKVQISFATEGGSGAVVPDLTIEVDDVETAYQQMKEAGFTIAYNLTTESWGIRRFYVRDPFGKLVNILTRITE
jgi:catechol 2,3-dioxygenase-like lactoylglutathione lyase family enzyme